MVYISLETVVECSTGHVQFNEQGILGCVLATH